MTEIFSENLVWCAFNHPSSFCDNDATMSGSERSSNSIGTPQWPRVVVARGSGGTSVSGMTTPQTRRSNRQQQQQQQRDEVSNALLQLAGTSMSTPQRDRLTAEREEDEIEEDLFPGSGNADSEDEFERVDFALALAQAERDLEALSVQPDRNEVSSGMAPHEPALYGAPVGWNPPSAPDDFRLPPPCVNKGEPIKVPKVDNPGGWSSFTYRPKFGGDRGQGTYLYHCLPTGATPVPARADGKRVIEQRNKKNEKVGEFEFHYQGWSRPADTPPFRHGASRDNVFPEERKGKLCRATLTRLVMSKE